ncbi:MAG: beta-N-acetylglucosaminidase domain-containing protein, partial [Bacteroidales bacterium]|nr:beta-N-acetylglucosaminidase domain-containing protein [Bacteroidales bacterium]
NLAQMVNPYAFFPKNSILDSLDSDIKEKWIHSGSSGTAKLRQYYSAGMDAGVSTLVLCTHDYLPRSLPLNYVLYSDRDADVYINLQEAHLELIRSLYSWSRARTPELKLEFIPPWYSNDDLDLSRGQAEQYFQDLSPKLPEDLRMMWSGPASQSSGIDEADFYRFHELAGRELILLDNSMNTIPEILEDTAMLQHQWMKLRTLNLFDPFRVKFSAPFSLPETTGKMLINSSLSSEIMQIRIATAADFMWNSGSYDPDLSIWKVLVSRFGISAARELYLFNDTYFTALASMIGLKQDIDQQRLVRQIDEQLDQLEKSVKNLDNLIPLNPGLLNELKSLKQSMESRYETETKELAGQIITAVESM